MRRAIWGEQPPDRDDDVLRLLDRGELSDALTQLMRRHGPAVYRYCREALRDATLADDVQQQVFVEAYRDLHRFRRRSTLRVWLFAIARHRVLDAAKLRRRRRDQVDEPSVPEPSDPAPLAGDQLDDERRREALVVCIAELDGRLRSQLLLRYQQGFTFEEIGRICGEKAGTIRARIERALPALRARIEELLRERRTPPWAPPPSPPRPPPSASHPPVLVR